MGVQDVYLLFPEQTPQPPPGPEVAQPAAGQGKGGEAPPRGAAIELAPGIAGQEQPMPPPLHGLGFGQDAAFLAAPAQGGFGVQNGKSPMRRFQLHEAIPEKIVNCRPPRRLLEPPYFKIPPSKII